MKNNVILKLVDSSSKECEVTGRMMGGDYTYEIPVSLLVVGLVKWPQKGEPDHAVVVKGIGEDSIEIAVRNVAGTYEPYTLRLGEKAALGYAFGEWSYGYTVTLEEVSEEKMKSLVALC
jgi:hypothetical protein